LKKNGIPKNDILKKKRRKSPFKTPVESIRKKKEKQGGNLWDVERNNPPQGKNHPSSPGT